MADVSPGFARVAKMHAQGNQRSRDGWELYRTHRERLTRTIDAVGERVGVQPGTASSLVLLGAGNCNDVELPALAARFHEIHLVDIDATAIERARQLQPPAIAERIVTHGGVELTGLLHRLDRWKSRPPDAAALEQAVAEGAATIAARLPMGRADVAVSCCLMSQLAWSLDAAVSDDRARPGERGGSAAGDGDHETGVELRVATIAVHLRTLAGLCRGGGAALLASDIVSSDLYPLDELPEDTDLKALAAELIAQQQVVYAGANPLLVSRTLRRDAVAKDAFAPLEVLDPWLWTGQFDRIYLVYPQLLRRL